MILSEETKRKIKDLIKSQKRSITLILAMSLAGAGATAVDSIKETDSIDHINNIQYEVLENPVKGYFKNADKVLDASVKEYFETTNNVLSFAESICNDNPSKTTVDAKSVSDTNTDNQVIDIDNMTAEEKDEFMRKLMAKEELTDAENDFVVRYIETLGERSIRKLGDDVYYNYLLRKSGPLTREENDFVTYYINEMSKKAQEDAMKDVPREGGFDSPEGGSDKEVYDDQKNPINLDEEAQRINEEAQQSYDQEAENIYREGWDPRTESPESIKENEASEQAGQELLDQIKNGEPLNLDEPVPVKTKSL